MLQEDIEFEKENENIPTEDLDKHIFVIEEEDLLEKEVATLDKSFDKVICKLCGERFDRSEIKHLFRMVEYSPNICINCYKKEGFIK
jgi:formylmethanofuran dehydrogenase subunit E